MQKCCSAVLLNVWRLVAERGLDAQCFNLAILMIRTTNDECSTSTLFATNRLLPAGRFISRNFKLKIK